jgi:hypothetical protein
MRPTMKSFRLYMPRRIPLPKFAPRCAADEQADFRDAFRPVAERYRRHSRRCRAIGIIAFIFWIAAIAFFPKVCPVLFAALLALAVYGWYTQPLVECPACRQQVASKPLARYCPECGGELEHRGWWRGPRCQSCGKTLYWGKSRNFKFRGCTHCGVLLDEQGL